MHKVSLLHAEKIIGELMESILDVVERPVVAHEILGDAISLYALNDFSSNLANDILLQVEKYFEVFKQREAILLSECSICICDACKSVGRLKIKAILHSGEAAFTKIHNIQKISGEDVIIAHRMLKNSIPSDEYILITRSFADKCRSADFTEFEEHNEEYDGVGMISSIVRNFKNEELEPVNVSKIKKISFIKNVFQYTLKSFLGKKSEKEFRNLPF